MGRGGRMSLKEKIDIVLAKVAKNPIGDIAVSLFAITAFLLCYPFIDLGHKKTKYH
jgi:hypothetical protein